MKVYLSSDRNDAFFIDAVKRAVGNIRVKVPVGVVELLYPPLALGVDTGKIMANILQVLEADIVLVNATPSAKIGEQLVHNPGVMMEYGMVIGQDSAPGGHRWMGRL